MKKKKKQKLKILGVCGGNGVILYPFRNSLIGNIEFRSIFKTKSNLQWYLNFKVPFVSDLMVAKFLFPKVDVIIGAPDCGHSSILTMSSTGKMKNPMDNESVKTFFGSILEYKPKLWLMENLPAMLNTVTMTDFKENFPEYRFIFHTLSVAEFGNSQKTRKRLVVIGIHRDLPSDVFMHMNDIYKVNELKKVDELIGDLQEDNIKIANIREDETKETKMGKKSFSFKAIAAKWNGDYKKDKYWKVDDIKNMPYIPGVYRLFKNDYPQTCRKDPRQFRPDGKPLSPRELARIQGVPDSFKLFINEEKLEHSINKARATVTKGAPYEIGLWFKKQVALCEPFLITKTSK